MGGCSRLFGALRAQRCALTLVAAWALGACAGGAPEPHAAADLRQAGPDVEVVSRREVAPEAADGAPLLTLAFRLADGTRVPIEGESVAFTPFRDGVAVMTAEGGLWLVSPDGARRRLAIQSATPPTLDSDGALLYAVRYGEMAELHRLTREGQDTVLAEGLRGVGLLAPQPDGRILFLGASAGGVAGLWLVDHAQTASCLTNCALRTGQDWGDAFVPTPPSVEAIQVGGDEARWPGPDGAPVVVSLRGAR